MTDTGRVSTDYGFKKAMTFDDVLLQPGYSQVLPHNTKTGT